MRFFDTNVLVYAATSQDRKKTEIARELIGHALEVNHDGVISVQIMSEFIKQSRTNLFSSSARGSDLAYTFFNTDLKKA